MEIDFVGTSFRTSIGVGLVLVLVGSVAADEATHRGFGYQAVAVTGQAAPGANGDRYVELGVPSINRAGTVAFSGRLSGPGVTIFNPFGLWSGPAGSVGLTVRSGRVPLGVEDGVLFRRFLGLSGDADGRFPVLAEDGGLGFYGFLTGNGVSNANDTGVWSGYGGSDPALIAREDAPAPQAPGRTFDDIDERLSFDAHGRVAFVGFDNEPGINFGGIGGVWSEAGGGLRRLASQGDTSPGFPGASFNSFTRGTAVVSSHGDTAFVASARGTLGSDGLNGGSGVWVDREGEIVPLALSGLPAPGTSAGTVYATFLGSDRPSINAEGQVAFRARLSGASQGFGIWAENDSGIRLVARAGQIAPGTSSQFSSVLRPSLNNDGEAAFYGLLIAPEDRDAGFWSEADGELSLVAREGELAPGTVAAHFGDFRFATFVQSEHGQLAFTAPLVGPGVEADQAAGLWATDRAGELQLLLRAGDTIDLDITPGGTDLRTIAAISLAQGNSDGRGVSFNANGTLAVRVDFADAHSAILVVTVPEPAAVGCVLLSVCLVRRGRGPWQRRSDTSTLDVRIRST